MTPLTVLFRRINSANPTAEIASATGKRSDRCFAGNHRAPHTKGCGAVLAAKHGINGRKHGRHDERSTDFLYCARGDQRGGGGRKSRQYAACHKYCQADEEGALASPGISNLAR